MIAVNVLIFILGALIGIVIGAAVCVRLLKQEMTARVAPTMELMRLQLDNLQSAVNLALANWHAELHDHSAGARLPHGPVAVAVREQDRRPES